jgi:hypothetical protein
MVTVLFFEENGYGFSSRISVIPSLTVVDRWDMMDFSHFHPKPPTNYTDDFIQRLQGVNYCVVECTQYR